MQTLLVINFLDEVRKPFDHIVVGFIVPQIHLLGFERFEKRFDERIVVGIAFGRHADGQATILQQLHVVLRRVLDTAVGMVNAADDERSPFQSHAQSCQTEFTVDPFGNAPSDDFARIQIQDRGQVNEARADSNVGYIGRPRLVRSR